ncbi:hypothetical protein M6B38_294780 [Iris pallida]|uniref:Uncharacterized protein n=1 Tax=Iris pallida TaxID=29817 RepID=A0AAX6HSN0_IRIPA|nr:hypothetical protein M6B38_217070 [Iris pallida]KAJ6844076.1 hypothetical protein M6B38_294780 [Iris pallida]
MVRAPAFSKPTLILSGGVYLLERSPLRHPQPHFEQLLPPTSHKHLRPAMVTRVRIIHSLLFVSTETKPFQAATMHSPLSLASPARR